MTTKQEVFTRVATHLLKQNAKSVASKSSRSCRYRGTNGLRCAIGALILDEAYSDDLEGHCASSDQVTEALRLSGVTRISNSFLDTLQDVHDDHAPAVWRARLEIVAHEHKLKMPTVLP
jgi:hypothetical protein